MAPDRRLSFAEGKASSSRRVSSMRKRSQSLSANDPRHRRLLAPRKSILKASSVDNTTEDLESTSKSEFDPRKSLNRRVSFAQNVSCRFIQNEQNTNSSGGPSSSPEQASPQQYEQPVIQAMPKLSDENDYPGRRTSIISNRRVSMGSEYGEASMSMEVDSSPVKPSIFIPPSPQQEDAESSLRSDEDDMEDDEDMEITEAIALNIHRKRSLSIAQQQAIAKRSSIDFERRLSMKQPSLPLEDQRTEVDEEGDIGNTTTTSQGSVEDEAHMEFTVPLGQSLRPPKPPSDAWLALQALTNSQTEAHEDEDEGSDMELTSAISRLQKLRSSLIVVQQNDDEASFSSTDDDSMDSIDMGDRTMNLTGLLGSVQNLELTEDLSETRETLAQEDEDILYAATETNSLQRHVQSGPTAVPLSPRVFSMPPEKSPDHGPASQPIMSLPSPKAAPSVFIQPPASPLKTIPVSSFNPPLAVSSGSRSTSPVQTQQLGDNEHVPAKRLAPPPESLIPQPSPSKKRSIPSEVTPLSQSQSLNRPQTSSNNSTTTAFAQPSGAAPPAKAGSGLRRPSGYFAQRRSLAPGTTNALSIAPTTSSGHPDTASQKKQLNRRASIAGVPSRKDVQDENHPVLPIPLRQGSEVKAKAHPPPPTRSASSKQLPESIEEVTEPATEGDLTELWRSTIAEQPQEDVYQEEIVMTPISIMEFFMMTGVKFMDELTIPRRSVHHPQLPDNTEGSDTPASLREYITAVNVHMPQLELYSWVAKDLQTWIDNNKKTYREAEEEVAKVTPILFREYSSADEEDRADLLQQLKLIKINKQLAAKGKWYEWKQQWMENLYEMANNACSELEADEKSLDQMIHDAEDLLPALREQHAQVLQELEKERSEIEEIERSDPAYIEELKIEIEEQNVLLESYHAELSEGNAKLERLEEKLAELDTQRIENVQAIEKAVRKITLHKNSTRTEVFRLKDDLESLQALHSWRVAKASNNLIEIVFDDRILVSIPCRNYRAESSEVSVSRIEKTGKQRPDRFPLLSELVVQQGQAHARKLRTTTIKPITEVLSDFWTSCSAIRRQLEFLSIKYPLKLDILPQGRNGFKATASMLLHKYKAKALVSFVFDDDILPYWPFKLSNLKCEVKIAYGNIDSEEVRGAVLERLSEASVENNHACLLDACVEAASRYET